MSNVEIKWIEDGNPAQRPFRAYVIGWQNSRYAINRLVQSYNDLVIPTGTRDGHQEMQIGAVRRQILASLLELKEKLDQRNGQLRKAGIDTASIEAIRKAHRSRLDKADSWRGIRNLTFHFGDVIEPDSDLVATYKSVLRISDAEVNDVWTAIVAVGEEMRKIALDRC